jgi:hypothetical protein
MRVKLFFALLIALCLASCKTYELKHYKGAELDNIGKVSYYDVYVHSKENTYKVDKPSLSSTELKGNFTPITDKAEVAEIKNPRTAEELKKHKHDLSLYTQTEIKDSTRTLKKAEITDVAHAVSHSKVNVGDILTTIFGLALCIGLLGVFIYWIVLAIGG